MFETFILKKKSLEPAVIDSIETKHLMGLVQVSYVLTDQRPDLEYGDPKAQRKYKHSINVKIARKHIFTANICSMAAGAVCFPQNK